MFCFDRILRMPNKLIIQLLTNNAQYLLYLNRSTVVQRRMIDSDLDLYKTTSSLFTFIMAHATS